MKLKRFLAIVLSALMICSCCICANAYTCTEDPDEVVVHETENGDIVSVAGVRVADIVDIDADYYMIVDYKGKGVSLYDYAATGMKIITMDACGNVLEEKRIIIFGDVNGDGIITAADSRRVLRASVDFDILNPWQKIAADVVVDEAVKADDARIILRASVNLENLVKIFEMF